jgi:16S rRNA (cytosine1402-N4)-methyltransferase
MYHVPVLLEASVEALVTNPDGVYVDATMGGAGHTRAILDRLGDQGRLYAFDQDEDAVRNVPEDSRCTFIPHNFRHLKQFLRLEGVRQIDGLLADLGVSSHQIDEAERGFSFRFDMPLDMRMDRSLQSGAAEVLNRRTAAELQRILGEYGEVRNARTLAQAIVAARSVKPLATTGDLVHLAEPLSFGKRNRYLAQIFQALRMEVNDELGALADLLNQATELLSEGGRLVVLSYHSLEDRLVKNLLKKGNPEGRDTADLYGRVQLPFRAVTGKPAEATDEEIEQNPRARSAKMRVLERLAH